MILFNSSQIAQAVGGIASENFICESVSIDSRNLAKNALFIAIKGENFDAHDYIKQAIDNGASGVISAHEAPYPHVLVKDTTAALVALARYARNNARKLIGLTGSVGKTSTKEMLAMICAKAGSVHATKGNLNNHYGMPLTLSNMPQVDYAVIEMGMNHAGEIAYLSEIAKPDIALITTVAAVHLENFPSVEGIAEAKAEIFVGMMGGKAILPIDNEYFAILENRAKQSGAEIITFGRGEKADFRLLKYHHGEIEFSYHNEIYQFSMPAKGEHLAMNAVAAIAASYAAGIDIALACEALSEFSEGDGRGKVLYKGDIILLDESYNASPISMKAAFAKLVEIAPERRKIAVLGDMKELGEQAAEMHRELANYLGDFSEILLVGSLMQNLADELGNRAKLFASNAELSLYLKEIARGGDAILFKGSHSMKIDEILRNFAGEPEEYNV